MENIIKEVSARVDEKRLKHTLAVASESLELAKIFELNKEETNSLYISALLHDLTKKYTVEQHTEICKKYGIVVSEYMLLAPKTFHALTGSLLAKELFPDIVTDEIIDNIRAHTTGVVNMTLAQKLLYLADYIEPTRTFGDCIKLREIFYDKIKTEDKFKALDQTLIISFDMTIRDLLENGNPVSVETTQARNYLLLEKARAN